MHWHAQKEENKRRVQADAAVEKKNAVSEWLELLASQDDSAWKENLIGMGSAPNVSKLFHNNGKVTLAVQHHVGAGAKYAASIKCKPYGPIRGHHA